MTSLGGVKFRRLLAGAIVAAIANLALSEIVYHTNPHYHVWYSFFNGVLIGMSSQRIPGAIE